MFVDRILPYDDLKVKLQTYFDDILFFSDSRVDVVKHIFSKMRQYNEKFKVQHRRINNIVKRYMRTHNIENITKA